MYDYKKMRELLNALEKLNKVAKNMNRTGHYSVMNGVIATKYDVQSTLQHDDYGVCFGIINEKLASELGVFYHLPMKIDGKALSAFMGKTLPDGAKRKKSDFVGFGFRSGAVDIIYKYILNRTREHIMAEYIESISDGVADKSVIVSRLLENPTQFAMAEKFVKQELAKNGTEHEDIFTINCGEHEVIEDFEYTEKFRHRMLEKTMDDVVDTVDITHIADDINTSEIPYRIDYSDGRFVTLMSSSLKGYSKGEFVSAVVKRIKHVEDRFSQNIVIIETKGIIVGYTGYTIT